MREDRQRLDKWLWFARFAKTRPVTVRLVEGGYARINGRRGENPAAALKLGDVLTLALAHQPIVVTVVGLGQRRGPYAEARRLYEPLSGEPSGDLSLAIDDPTG